VYSTLVRDLPVFGNTVYLKIRRSFPVKLVKVTVLNDWILLTGSDDIRGGMKKIFINELKTLPSNKLVEKSKLVVTRFKNFNHLSAGVKKKMGPT